MVKGISDLSYQTPSSLPALLVYIATSLIVKVMPGLAAREVGALFRNEEWWRDQYIVIYGRGYQLRPRYHPNWEPSWTRSGKDFFAVEDGQPTIVCVLFSRY